jgi:hypothetical protein
MSREPPKPEVILAEIASWKIIRPTHTIALNGSVESSFADNIASIHLCIYSGGYEENWPAWPSDGDDDILWPWIEASINLSRGFVHTVTIRFSPTDADTDVIFEGTASFMVLRNLEIRRVRSLGSHYREVFFETRGIGQPRNVFISETVILRFLDTNAVDHWLTVNLDVTYFNGTAYRKATVPITLGVPLK